MINLWMSSVDIKWSVTKLLKAIELIKMTVVTLWDQPLFFKKKTSFRNNVLEGLVSFT